MGYIGYASDSKPRTVHRWRRRRWRTSHSNSSGLVKLLVSQSVVASTAFLILVHVSSANAIKPALERKIHVAGSTLPRVGSAYHRLLAGWWKRVTQRAEDGNIPSTAVTDGGCARCDSYYCDQPDGSDSMSFHSELLRTVDGELENTELSRPQRLNVLLHGSSSACQEGVRFY